MDPVDALFAAAPKNTAPAPNPHAGVDDLFQNLPKQKSTYPLTAGNTALGIGEIGGTAIRNMVPAVGNAAVDAWRFLHGEPEKQTFNYSTAGDAAQNLLSHIAQIPMSTKYGYRGPPTLGAVGQALSQKIAAFNPLLRANNPKIAPAVEGAERVVGDLSTLLPVASLGKDLGMGILRSGVDIPTKEALAEQAQEAYRRAENAGVVVKPESLNGLQQVAAQSLRKEGLDQTLHPATTAALGRLTGASGPQSLQEMEILRRVAKAAEGAQTPDDRRLAGQLVDHIDEFIGNLQPSDVQSGNAQEGAQALAQARSLWSRKRKADTIDELMDRARLQASQFSGSGLENATRTQFRQLAMNKKRLRVFTPEEQNAIRRVAQGGTTENALRLVGKLAPTGVVSTALGAGLGATLGGPLGAAAVPAAGWGAREAATLLTLRNAKRAGALMRRGPPPSLFDFIGGTAR